MEPNDICLHRCRRHRWPADYKGQFRLKNGKYCFPLTVSDPATRFILGVDAHPTISLERSFAYFRRLFQEYGLPKRIRTDNGVPFASYALARLSQLSVWFTPALAAQVQVLSWAYTQNCLPCLHCATGTRGGLGQGSSRVSRSSLSCLHCLPSRQDTGTVWWSGQGAAGTCGRTACTGRSLPRTQSRVQGPGNGVHERMHRTLIAQHPVREEEATIPPANSLKGQKKKFNCFRKEFNQERPHEALEMKRPAELYQPSS